MADHNKNNPQQTSKQKTPQQKVYLAPAEVENKTKSILKEYFVGGDTADAILSLDEMIGVGSNFATDRGTAALRAGVLLVLEQKDEQVTQFLTVIQSCTESEKLPKPCLALALMEPLEALRDIQIDAPLAHVHFSKIMADWMRREWVTLKVLQSGPEYFLSDGRPAELAKQVLQERGGDVSDQEVNVVTQLLSEAEREEIESVRDWISAK